MKPPPTPLAVLLNPRVQTVRVAREVGARTLMVGPDLTAPGMNRVVAEADQALEADWRDYRQLAAALDHLAGRSQAAVFGFEDATALAASRANWCLRLPGSSPMAVAVLSDPLLLRERVNQCTRTPVRFAICGPSDLPRTACQVGFPCAVRPRHHPAPDRAPVLQDVVQAERLAQRMLETELVIEEYLDGPRVVVEAHSYHGSHTVHSTRAVNPPGTDGGPSSDWYGTAGFDPDQDTCGRELRRLVSDTLDAADYVSGASQITVALTARGPRLVAARACPSERSTLTSHTIAAVLGLGTVARRAKAS